MNSELRRKKKMFSFFSKRFRKNSPISRRNNCDENTKYSKNVIPCKIVLLDGSVLTVEVTVSIF